MAESETAPGSGASAASGNSNPPDDAPRLAPIRLGSPSSNRSDSSEPADPSPRPARRGPYRKSQQTRENILAAAMEVFRTHGFRATAVAEIADRLGLDQSSIFYYFPNKTELLLAVMRERDRQADVLLEWMTPRSLAEMPDLLIELATRNATTPGVIELYTVLAAESITPDHPLSDYFRDRLKRVRDGFTVWFRWMEENGALRDGVDPALAASSFFALWEGAQLHWLIDPPELDVVAHLRQFLSLVLRDPAAPAAR